MHDPLAAFLREYHAIILDGGLATELERRGADLQDPLWSARVLLEAPELIRQVHFDYFAAGADVATTASYQATFPGFAVRGIEHERAAELMRLSVRLAQQARDDFWQRGHTGRLRPLVAASVGCYGAYLHDGSEYRGAYGLSVQQLMDFHRPRMQVLVECGPDLLACETIPCQIEAEALVRLLAEFPSTPAWLSFSCRDDVHVCHGETLVECVAVTESSPQVVAVAINCTAPRFISGLLRRLHDTTAKPILVYPNSGETWNAANRTWAAKSAAENWSKMAQEWFALGASGVGGCCRTTPETIRVIKHHCESGARAESGSAMASWDSARPAEYR